VPAAGYVQGMASFGYFLSCEEFGPRELVHQARLAERAGFERLWISDHFHPWNDAQGHSLFVWSVIGVPDGARSYRGGRSGGRDRGRAVRRAVRARCRLWRGAQRAHPG
jgi:hypothetical protein